MHRSYGLEVQGLSRSPGLVGKRVRCWHPLVLERQLGRPPEASVLDWSPDEVRLDAAGRLSLVVRRAHVDGAPPRQALSATVTAPEPIEDAEIEHPLLAFVAGVAARWSGRTALHGAAVVLHGRSWVLVGGPGSGKSTLAGALSRVGYPVQSDDLAVIDGDVVFGGPRSYDLRDGSADQLGRGRPVHRQGERRWRSPLGEAPYEAPLGGLIDLRWGDRPELGVVPLTERLGVLARAEAFGRGPSEPGSFLPLLAVPMVALTRTRSWDDLDRTVGLLETAASG